jgi:hypothetical protein
LQIYLHGTYLAAFLNSSSANGIPTISSFSCHFGRCVLPPNIFTFAPLRLVSIVQLITVHCSVHCPSLLFVTAFCHRFLSLLIIIAFCHCSVQWLVFQVLHSSLKCLLVCCLFYRVWKLILRLHFSHCKRILSYVCSCILQFESVRCCGLPHPCSLLFALNSNISSPWPSLINLCTSAMSCFSNLSSSVSRLNSAHLSL